jgi:uncharacterized protein (DUF2336 family)
MSVATSLIPGLDKLVRQGDSRRLADAVRRIAELLVQKAATFRPDHIDLFDHVLIDLVPHAAIAARAELAWQLSALANGPKVLLEIARIKGQGHLLAITERPALSADLTDVILRRADRDVVRRVAANAGALFSESGYSALIRRAGTDGVLTLKLGQREDLPDRLLKALLAGSIEIVRRRLFEIATPERQAAIGRAMSEIGTDSGRIENGKDFVPAQRAVLALHRAGNLNEAALLGFAKEYRYEEAVAALSAMSGVQLATLDRLVSGERHDPILIVGKAIGLQWATVRALILLRLGPSRIASPTDIENARSKFARLMPSTAERMLSFWQARQSA